MCVCVSPERLGYWGVWVMKWTVQFALMSLWQGQEVVWCVQPPPFRRLPHILRCHLLAQTHTFSSFCCRAFVCLFFALTSGNQRVSEMRGNQTQIVIQHENKRDIHCSHSSHLPVSQIIISEWSTLINAAPCLHWWGLWLMRMIQYIYTTDLEVSSMYSIWYSCLRYYMGFSVDLVCQTCCMPVDDCLSVYVLHALSCLCCCQYGWTSSLHYCSFIQSWHF